MILQQTRQASPLGIPYFRPTDPDSHDFIDLKAEPHRLLELPELRAEPELAKLMQMLNAADSLCKSTGCERWYDERERPEGKTNYGSYFGFALDAWPFQAVEASYSTIERFHEFSSARPVIANAYARFDVRPTRWNREDRTGWSLEFWTWGFGSDRGAARAAWIAGIGRFLEFFVFENETWRAFLATHPTPTPSSDAERADQGEVG